jgi:tetratricopeptide (TPR) repeat protein
VRGANQMFDKFISRFKTQQIALDNEGDALFNYKNGLRLVRKELYQEALQEFKQSAARNPTHSETFLQLGSVYFSLDRFSEAEKAYKKVLEFDPQNADAYNNLGRIYDRKNLFVQAISAFMRALRIKRDHIEARNNLGATYFKMGSYNEAVKAYEQILKINPDDITALYGLGLVYLDLRDKQSVKEKSQILEGLNKEMAADLIEKLNYTR